MSRTSTLRHSVINQFIEAISLGHITSPLPSQSTLADMFNISRTTVIHVLSYLMEQGVLQQAGGKYAIARQPTDADGFDVISGTMDEQTELFESRFYHMINQRQILPGDTITELQLARQCNVRPVVVREFLLRFSRYDLMESVRRGHWKMKQFDQEYAEKLFELREMLEVHALNCFMNLSDSDSRWITVRELLENHRHLRNTINQNYRMFSLLDQQLHMLLISAANNPFFDQMSEIISVIFHFHYQWDDRALKQRNTLAVEEHLAILSAMACRDRSLAMRELRQHLDTAKQSMIQSIERHAQ
ncbi:GntR family transcriptional regulator [Brenneria roseae subsp. roseae]|uniref:GntR family transcriptional regulator n=1 Tax=Brenneria roseae TaxID=1509241 RepID=UPI000D6038EE|nr:GntR family transcriptional regulator [Brenneria roseae]PWC21662.1 GntR family transcriptional regulator [Brenneria roseae subsp. roseae]